MKTVCIIQARMGSERLPGKVMKDIMGKPMITYTLDRVKKSKYIDEVILATSEKETEQPMVDYLKANQYIVFRGEENHVLKRYYDAASYYKADTVIRITGDCPLIDATIIDQVITYFNMNTYDYVRLNVPETFIRGFDVEIFSMKALERVYQIANQIEGDSPYKEHVTLYMYQHPEEFQIGIVKGSEYYQKPYRLCVDTKEDYELVKTVYEHFKDRYISAKEVIAYLDSHLELAQMNQAIHQKTV